MTIYNYEFNLKEPLKQGDILRNIPYLSVKFLTRSTFELNKPNLNQSEEITQEIINNGDPIQIETFLNSTLVILATQDCDIRPEYNLVCYPIKLINASKKTQTRNYFKQTVRETTRNFYLPKLKFQTLGPFHVLLQRPFTIPYEYIFKNIKKCWFARINDYARKVFVAKITHHYSRLPFEELIFAENYEISNYLDEFKKKFKGNKSKIINRINDIKIALQTCNREKDIERIPFNSYTI